MIAFLASVLAMWFFSAWLIAQNPTRSFLALSFVIVFVAAIAVTVASAYLSVALMNEAVGPMGWNVSAEAALRSLICNFAFGAWALVGTYRSLRSPGGKSAA